MAWLFKGSQDVGRVQQFRARVVGMTVKNPDGTSRQRLIAGCLPGMEVELAAGVAGVPEGGIGVVRKNGSVLGFLPEEEALKVTEGKNAGRVYLGIIVEVGGGTARRPAREVSLLVFSGDKGLGEKGLRRYVAGVSEESFLVRREEEVPLEPRMRDYVERLVKVLEDGRVSEGELERLEPLREKLSAEEVRAAHVLVYEAFMADVYADGKLTAEEDGRLRAMRERLFA